MYPYRSLTKFLPLALLAAIQLVLVLLVPSVAGQTGTNALAGGGVGQVGVGAGGAGTSGVGGVSGVGGTAGGLPGQLGSGTAAGGSASSAAGGTQSGGGGASGGGTTQSTGDTTHCVAGRQFNPSIDYYAPPCVPGTVGAPMANNGGTTSMGVTNNKIEIVHYVPDYGAEVNTILQAQGLYYTAQTAAPADAAYQNFINSHYQLYGRKVHVDLYQGTCQTVPPDYQCLNAEMDTMVAKYHPYAVLFSTTLCSACFAELARLHVVSTGGAGFSDAFHNANAPYVYDASESASRIELQFADWWCHQMTSQRGTGRTAVFAGTENPAENFTNKPRVLGVVSTNDPDNEATVKNVLYPALKAGCGESVTHEYYYAQDINTATQQSNAGTAAMNTTTNPATSVLCLCDPVAPQFSYNASAGQNYWPEALFASDQTMDLDSIAQTYAQGGASPSLACPKPAQGCSFDGAIGLGTADPQTAPAQMAGVQTYELGSGSKNLPLQPPTLQIFWDNFNLLASLIENTGPMLTPARMAAAAPAMGGRGGGTTGHALRGFASNDYCWIQDSRVIYWDKNKPSPYNNQNGTYVKVGGTNFNFNFPTATEPAAPAAADRH